jgi:origin recognition complex subunit 3
MCHVYANPLSILLSIPECDSTLSKHLSKTHLDAIRSLPSVRRYIETKLECNSLKEARAMLTDNEYMLGLLPKFVADLQSSAEVIKALVIILSELCKLKSSRLKVQLPTLYLNTLQGEIDEESPLVRELLLLQKLFPIFLRLMVGSSDGRAYSISFRIQ